MVIFVSMKSLKEVKIMQYFIDTWLHTQVLKANLVSVLRKQHDENNFFHITPIGNTQNKWLIELSLEEGDVLKMHNKGNDGERGIKIVLF